METLQKIHAKWRCLQDVCCRNGEGYLPLGYCDKVLCKRRISVEIPKPKRCSDCKHYGKGYTYFKQMNKQDVCFAKPKGEKGERKTYYVALWFQTACDNFKPKTDKK